MQEDQSPAPAEDTSTATWTFTGEPAAVMQNAPVAPNAAVSWTASEFIAHTKSAGWYFLLMIITLATAIVAYIITGQDKLTPIAIIIGGILFGIMAARKPRELPYQIDAKGIHVDTKSYPYSNFKSFSVVQEEGVESIWLLPLQRFTPGLSIYFAPDDKDKILDILEGYLPVEHKQLDYVDKLMHKIRF